MRKPGFVISLLVACMAFAGSGLAATKRFLVVAPNSFKTALQEFIAYKQNLLPTEFVSLEMILDRSSGVDDPEKLKRFLYQQWREHQLGYALLVGDVDIFPVRFMVLDRVTPAAFDYAFYPSDLYYSDLAKADGSFEDWNAHKDSFHAGYFGEVRGEKNKQDPINYDQVDYQPEIAVGRWPVSTPEEAVRVAAKTMTYERSVLFATNQPLRHAAFIATGGWVDSRQLMGELVSKFNPGWQVEKRFYGAAPQTAAQDGAAGNLPPTHEALRSLLAGGLGLLVHAGHGEPDGWDQCLSLRDLDCVTNGTQLPVVISAGCSTAYFAPLPPYGAYVDTQGKEHDGTDNKEVFTEPPPPPSPYQRGRFNPSGLGEKMLKRSSGGSVAYIGCDTGSQPCGLTLVEGFVTAVAKTKEPRLGDCWAEAVRFYYQKEHLADLKPNDDWYPPSIFFQGMKFMLFGDPSLRMPENSKLEARNRNLTKPN